MTNADELSNALRQKALAVYEQGEAADKDIAERLGIFPTGLRRILHESHWSLDRSVQVLDALGVNVRIEEEKS